MSRIRTFWSHCWLMVVCLLSMTVAVGAAMQADPNSATTEMWAMTGWLFGVGIVAMLPFRSRWPVLLTIAASAIALIFPSDGICALVFYSWVITKRPQKQALWLSIPAALALGVSLLRDAVRPDNAKFFASVPTDGGQMLVATPWLYLFIWVAGLTLAVLTGWLRRERLDAKQARQDVARQSQVSGQLRDDVARHGEREVFAREMHDTLAQSLSRVALGADLVGKLATDQTSEPLRRAAGVVQENAHQSLQELRGLISRLRDPDADSIETGSLEEISQLFTAMRDGEARVMATVMIDDPSSAPPLLSRTVYRVLQECLTNADKHAPGAAVLVEIAGGPGQGIRIHVANPMPAIPPLSTPGSRTGLVGLTERVRLADGEVTYGQRGQEFVVDVCLPWPAESA